jgi:hypothetical protein
MSSPLRQAGFQGSAEEVGVADAGDFVRVLEGKEEAGAAAGIDGHVEDVFAIEEDLAAGDFVVFVAAEDLAQSAFARTVRAHDGMDFTGVDGEIEAFEDFAAGDLSVEVFDFEGHEGGENDEFRMTNYFAAQASQVPWMARSVRVMRVPLGRFQNLAGSKSVAGWASMTLPQVSQWKWTCSCRLAQ